MKHHEFATIWPVMEGEALADLAADIAANGLRVAVLTYGGKVLDGRSREAACKIAGIEPRYEEAAAHNDREALNLVFSLNQYRRHLSMEQRAFAAARLANIINGHNQYSPKIMGTSIEVPSNNSTVSVHNAAAKLQVSHSAVDRARTIISHGTAEDEKAVVEGKVALSTKAAQVSAKAVRPAKKEKPPKRAKPGRPRKEEVRQAPPAKIVSEKGSRFLTPQEVDPEFTGTGLEFVAKYGHVLLHTAEQRATIRYTDWAINVGSLSRAVAKLPNLPEVDENWLRKPDESSHRRMLEALAVLEPIVARARALADRADAALASKVARRLSIVPSN